MKGVCEVFNFDAMRCSSKTHKETFLIKLAINVNALANCLIRKGGRRTRQALLSSLASRGQMLCDTVYVSLCLSLGLHPLTPSLICLSSYLLLPIPSPALHPSFPLPFQCWLVKRHFSGPGISFACPH